MPVVQNCIASIVRRANLTYSASVKLNFGGVADMRSGGSVLEAPPGAEEGALPREHRPQAGCAELTRASSACRIYKLFTYAEKALRYPGEPFLYVLDLAKLNLDGIAAMRNGEAPSSRRLAHSLIGAPMRGHSPASIVRVPVVRNCTASIVRKPAVQNLREHPLRAGQQTSCTSIRQHVRTARYELLVQVIAQNLRTRRVTELRHGLRLDLADSFAGHAVDLTNLV